MIDSSDREPPVFGAGSDNHPTARGMNLKRWDRAIGAARRRRVSWRGHLALWLPLAAAILFVEACGFGEASQRAKTAIGRFHENYNRQDYAQIYKAADGAFKAKTDEASFVNLLTAVQRKLGRELRTQVVASNITVGVGVSRVRMLCSSVFEGGNAQEEFVCVVDSGPGRLLAYTITSPMLVMK